MNVFLEPLRELEAYNYIRQKLEDQQYSEGCETEEACGILADSCADPQKTHLLYALCREDSLSGSSRLRLVLTHSDRRAREIAQDCAFYDKNVFVFPARDLIFYQADLRGNEIDKERLRCLRRILEGKPVTVVTTFASLMTPQIPLRVLKENVVEIGKREAVDLAELTRRLVEMGYEKNYQTERPGQFAVRGDILDVFDLTQDNPIRIEFWGDEVETIRSFDVLSQRSVEQLEFMHIFPASEMILENRRLQDGLSRIRREADRVVKKHREQGNPEAAHRLKTEIARITEEVGELHLFSGLESFIHYFYPMTESLLDLFPREQTLVFLDEPQRILQHANGVETEFRESMISRSEKGYVLPGQMDLIRETPEILMSLEKYRRVGMTVLAGTAQKTDVYITSPDRYTLENAGGWSASSSIGEELIPLSPRAAGNTGQEPVSEHSSGGREDAGRFAMHFERIVQMHAREASLSGLSYEGLREQLSKMRAKKERVIIVSPSRTRAKRLAEQLTLDDVTAFYRENVLKPLKPGDVMTYSGRMRKGFSYPEIGFTMLTESDIFGEEKKKRKKIRRFTGGDQIKKFSELRVGDFVVHEQYGIGIYRGVEKIEVDHIARDYLKIEYGAGGVLYIMPTDLSVLQKYAGGEGARKPKLNKLGTQEWNHTRSRVQKSVEAVADDLVELYAKRQAKKGHVYGKDTVWQRELEEMFPYEETEDQLTAIEETKRDMESDKIMDRLICGDVGFGKTEIAIRAAFKAVQDGKQVAVLVCLRRSWPSSITILFLSACTVFL